MGIALSRMAQADPSFRLFPYTALFRSAGGTSMHPIVEEIVVRVPVASGARNLSDLKPSRGEAHYSPGDTAVEWRLGSKDAARSEERRVGKEGSDGSGRHGRREEYHAVA